VGAVSDKLAKWAEAEKAARGRPPRSEELRPGERKALWKLRAEAQEVGSHLASGGKGGLPPSLVLGVMRRDKYRCKTCGVLGTKDNGLSVHHKGGIVESKWLSKKGHANDPNNIVSICERCHDRLHEKAREEGVDSSQVKPEGDK
jgi:5-methylcytosine-specific restriction endonuclease McrA